MRISTDPQHRQTRQMRANSEILPRYHNSHNAHFEGRASSVGPGRSGRFPLDFGMDGFTVSELFAFLKILSILTIYMLDRTSERRIRLSSEAEVPTHHWDLPLRDEAQLAEPWRKPEGWKEGTRVIGTREWKARISCTSSPFLLLFS